MIVISNTAHENPEASSVVKFITARLAFNYDCEVFRLKFTNALFLNDFLKHQEHKKPIS